jgi:hypothetical protein
VGTNYTTAMLWLFKSLWRWQHAFLHAVIALQNRVLMTVVYVVAMAPVAVLLKLFRQDLLHRGDPEQPGSSYWVPREDDPMTMDRARRMF